VRRNRVRERKKSAFDIHDRVNYAVTSTELFCSDDDDVISLKLTIDEDICTMYDYFEIFLSRMMMCSRAAEILDAKFELIVNGQKVL
jgi:hypothetical protein